MINLTRNVVEQRANNDAVTPQSIQTPSDQYPKGYETHIYGEIKNAVRILEEEFEKIRSRVSTELDSIKVAMKNWVYDSVSIIEQQKLKDEIVYEWASIEPEVVKARAEEMLAYRSMQDYMNAFEPPIQQYEVETAARNLDDIGAKNNWVFLLTVLLIDAGLAFVQWALAIGYQNALAVVSVFAIASVLVNYYMAENSMRKPKKKTEYPWVYLVGAFFFNYMFINIVHWTRNLLKGYDAYWLISWAPSDSMFTTTDFINTAEKMGASVELLGGNPEAVQIAFFWGTFILNFLAYLKMKSIFEPYDGHSKKYHDWKVKQHQANEQYQKFRKILDSIFTIKRNQIAQQLTGSRDIEKDLSNKKQGFINSMKEFQVRLDQLEVEANGFVTLYRNTWRKVSQHTANPPAFWDKDFSLGSSAFNIQGERFDEIFSLKETHNQAIIDNIQAVESKFSDQSSSEQDLRKKMFKRENEYLQECSELIKDIPSEDTIDQAARQISIQRENDETRDKKKTN